jgi:hypothetical protein
MLWELRHIKTLFIKISFYSRTKWFLMWELGQEFCPYFVPELGQNMFMQYVFQFFIFYFKRKISIFKYMLRLFLLYRVIWSHRLNIVSCCCHLHSKFPLFLLDLKLAGLMPVTLLIPIIIILFYRSILQYSTDLSWQDSPQIDFFLYVLLFW